MWGRRGLEPRALSAAPNPRLMSRIGSVASGVCARDRLPSRRGYRAQRERKATTGTELAVSRAWDTTTCADVELADQQLRTQQVNQPFFPCGRAPTPASREVGVGLNGVDDSNDVQRA